MPVVWISQARTGRKPLLKQRNSSVHLVSSEYREMAVSSSACNTCLAATFPFSTKYLLGFQTELGLIFPLQPKKHHQHPKRIQLHTCTGFLYAPVQLCTCSKHWCFGEPWILLPWGLDSSQSTDRPLGLRQIQK